MTPFLAVGLIIGCGLLVAKIINAARLPAVTGYLVAGMLIGPSVTSIIPSPLVSELGFIESLALAFIAFSIGKEFQWDNLKRVGPGILTITAVQGLGAVAFVLLGLLVLGQSLSLALVLGAIATATAPAATVLVIKEYQADGPMTKTLLQVVALDDALGLIVFGMIIPVTRALEKGVVPDIGDALFKPVFGIIGALAVGLGIGILLSALIKKLNGRSNARLWTIAAVLTGAGIAETLGWSELLVNMAIGTAFVNSTKDGQDLAEEVEDTASPIYVPFFVLAGASLNLGLVPKLGMLGVAYLLFRSAGKTFGAWLGASMAGAPEPVRKYLGLGLLPQAGVAIGMVAIVRQSFPELADVVTTVILGSVMIYEIIGPAMARIAIFRAGEAHRFRARHQRCLPGP